VKSVRVKRELDFTSGSPMCQMNLKWLLWLVTMRGSGSGEIEVVNYLQRENRQQDVPIKFLELNRKWRLKATK
jgi:hypothetical protein